MLNNDSTKVEIKWHNLKIKSKQEFENKLIQDKYFQSDKVKYKQTKCIKTKEKLEYYFYDAYYKGVKIKGCSITLLTVDGEVKCFSSRVPDQMQFSGKDGKLPTIYYKEILENDSIISESYSYVHKKEAKNEFILALEIVLLRNGVEYLILLDAESGQLITKEIQKRHATTPNTFQTVYNGTQTAYFKTYTTMNVFGSTNTWWKYTYEKVKAGDVSRDIWSISDEDDSPSQAGPNTLDQKIASAFWAGQKAYTYLRDIIAAPNIPTVGIYYANWANNDEIMPDDEIAYYTSERAAIVLSNDKPICKDAVSVDIIGHEYGHHIIHEYTNGLYDSYYNEPGALMEGIGDIFGRAIQNYAEGYNAQRIETLGEDVVKNDNQLLRSCNNPNSLGFHFEGSSGTALDGQPDTYDGLYYWRGYQDKGGVHINNGVINYWMYLLSMGGTGNNDHGTPYEVGGIGINNGAKIVFYALPFLLFESEFSDFRDATIISAETIFGIGSEESKQVINAWGAVGVQGNGPTSVISGHSIVCSTNKTFSLLNVPSGSTVHWTASSNVQISNPTTTSIQLSSRGSGNGWLRATVNSEFGSFTTKEYKFWTGVPQTYTLELNGEDILYGIETCPGEYTSINIGDPYDMQINDSYWDFPSSFWIYNTGDDYANFSTPTNFDYAVIPLTTYNACGSDMFEFELYNGYCGGAYYMSISPNPSMGEVTLSLEPEVTNSEISTFDSSVEKNAFDSNVEWEYVVFSQNNQLMEKKTKLKGKSHKINTSGWKSGIYVIQAKYKDQVISGKLYVK